MSEPIGRLGRATAGWHRIRGRLQEPGASSAEAGEPHAFLTLVTASLTGLVVISLWRFQHRLGPSFVQLFRKEGPIEDASFLLALVASVWCAGAVWRFWHQSAPPAPPRPVLWLFSFLAGALFALGMEEINWGQTLLGFHTPDTWKEVNHQQETSLHNLLDRNQLEGSARVMGLLLTAGVIALVAVRLRWPKSLLAQISPHPTLVPLSLCIAYASLKQHSEVVELLIPIFFAFYTYRLWALARTSERI
jgi:hypothetical protein